MPDLKLSLSKQTIKYVRYFTRSDRGRDLFETWLKRSGRFQEMIQTELRARNMPEDLIWLAMIESGFDPTARSPAGAVGLWQFMPATGQVYGLRAHGPWAPQHGHRFNPNRLLLDPYARAVTGTFRWEGRQETAEEWLCLIKTRQDRYAELERAILAVHPYDVPEILALPVVAGCEPYLAWLRRETTPPAQPPLEADEH